jgi:hypothetical protein
MHDRYRVTDKRGSTLAFTAPSQRGASRGNLLGRTSSDEANRSPHVFAESKVLVVFDYSAARRSGESSYLEGPSSVPVRVRNRASPLYPRRDTGRHLFSPVVLFALGNTAAYRGISYRGIYCRKWAFSPKLAAIVLLSRRLTEKVRRHYSLRTTNKLFAGRRNLRLTCRQLVQVPMHKGLARPLNNAGSEIMVRPPGPKFL